MNKENISIHAPPRGATGCACSVVGGMTIFQFTPLREGRRKRLHCDFRSARISIHAPPRGATRAAHVAVEVLDDFNSRPSARGDGKRHAP